MAVWPMETPVKSAINCSNGGHNSPLYQSPPNDPDGSCHTGINYLVNTRGIPENQINLGLAFWGKRYNASNINEPFTGEVTDIRYNQIPALIGNGWSYQWDSDAYCPYLIKNDDTKILTFDDPEAIRFKCEYALEKELGGVMIWALGYDETEDSQELIQSIQNNYLHVESENTKIIPETIAMKVYPNPFNPICKMDIELSKLEQVQLNILSIKGEHIITLVDEKLNKGRHSFIWDGKTKLKRKSSSGLFLIELMVGNSKRVEKVILIK